MAAWSPSQTCPGAWLISRRAGPLFAITSRFLPGACWGDTGHSPAGSRTHPGRIAGMEMAKWESKQDTRGWLVEGVRHSSPLCPGTLKDLLPPTLPSFGSWVYGAALPVGPSHLRGDQLDNEISGVRVESEINCSPTPAISLWRRSDNYHCFGLRGHCLTFSSTESGWEVGGSLRLPPPPARTHVTLYQEPGRFGVCGSSLCYSSGRQGRAPPPLGSDLVHEPRTQH